MPLVNERKHQLYGIATVISQLVGTILREMKEDILVSTKAILAMELRLFLSFRASFGKTGALGIARVCKKC